jgi:hypothetical protein
VDVGRRHHAELGVPAGVVAADHADVGAEAVVAAPAPLALATLQGRVHQHTRTEHRRRHPGAGRHNVAGDVHAGAVRQPAPRQQWRPGPLDDVEPVERRGPHGDEHLARARLRIGPGDFAQDVDVAVDVVDDGPHDDAARWSRNSSYV